MTFEYDLAVIGSGPAGQRAAIQAAKLGKRAAVIEREPEVGGMSARASTSSKTLREAALHLTGYRERNVYGESFAVKQNITMSDLLFRTDYVMKHEADVLRSQLARNRLELINGNASFVDRHTLGIADDEGGALRTITADKIVIAVGTYSTAPPVVYADGRLVFVSDDVLNLPELPRTLTVVGAGAIGLEYCCTFAALGVRVMLESGKQIVSDAAMYCVGRTGNTESLALEAVGLEADERGRLSVDEHYQTGVEGIYAVGGVIGFPDLVPTSQLQGRLAACHAFGVPAGPFSELFPYNVQTIPEVAMVGPTEAELTEQGVPYEVGKASYRESVRSMIIGNEGSGLLKLLFEIESRKLLGVHIIGDGAAELIQIGQAVIAHDGTIDYFTEAAISYPTLAACYATAALDGINRLQQ